MQVALPIEVTSVINWNGTTWWPNLQPMQILAIFAAKLGFHSQQKIEQKIQGKNFKNVRNWRLHKLQKQLKQSFKIMDYVKQTRKTCLIVPRDPQ